MAPYLISSSFLCGLLLPLYSAVLNWPLFKCQGKYISHLQSDRNYSALVVKDGACSRPLPLKGLAPLGLANPSMFHLGPKFYSLKSRLYLAISDDSVQLAPPSHPGKEMETESGGMVWKSNVQNRGQNGSSIKWGLMPGSVEAKGKRRLSVEPPKSTAWDLSAFVQISVQLLPRHLQTT